MSDCPLPNPDELLSRLDDIARGCDPYAYGLPIYSEPVEQLREAVREYAASENAALRAENEALGRTVDRMENALLQIANWARAYPLSVFPEPDFKRAHEVLQAAGMGIDAISASNMRHVITQVKAIVDTAIAAESLLSEKGKAKAATEGGNQ